MVKLYSKIDINQDVERIKNYLTHRLRQYTIKADTGRQLESISMITLGFQIDQSGWVALVFDTRINGDMDGTWTKSIQDNFLPMNHWSDAIDQLYDNQRPIKVVMPNKRILIIDDPDSDIELYKCLGIMLTNLLVKSIEKKHFCKLPIARSCFATVEELMGNYAWPAYDDRANYGRIICDNF